MCKLIRCLQLCTPKLFCVNIEFRDRISIRGSTNDFFFQLSYKTHFSSPVMYLRKLIEGKVTELKFAHLVNQFILIYELQDMNKLKRGSTFEN